MAFPTLGLIDQFNRADENPLGNSTWSGPIFTGESQLRIVSNEVLPNSGSGDGNSYLSSTHGPDIEAYCTLTSTFATGYRVIFYFRSTVGASVNGYRIAFRNVGGDQFVYIDRMDASVNTNLTTIDITDTVASGDKFGAEMIGSTINAYWKAGAGSWTNIGSAVDSTYSAAGKTGLSLVTAGVKIDDFGGGTLGGAAPTLTLRTLGSPLRV